MDFKKLRHIIFFGVLIAVSIVLLYMLRPFALPIFWAAVIAGIFYPLYKNILKKFKSKNLTAGVTLIIIFIVIILPLSLLATLIASESVQVYSTLDTKSEQIQEAFKVAGDWIKHNPLTARMQIDEQFWADKFSEASKIVATTIFNTVRTITQNSLIFLAGFVLMMYTLFFFLRDGERMLKFLMYLCPLGDKYEKSLYKKFTSTASATLKGTLIVGGIQGLFGAILFLLTGVQGAVIWGLVMAVASIIPAFGTGIVWAPVGVYMLLTGNIWQGILILTFGFLVISTVDNLIRPILIGKDTAMHPVIVLFSTLGGLVMFGFSGLVIGPVIASLFLALWEMYENYYQDELCKNNTNGL